MGSLRTLICRMIHWVLGSLVPGRADRQEPLVTRLHIRELNPKSQIYLEGHTVAQGQESPHALESMVPPPSTEEWLADGAARAGRSGARRAACGRTREGRADVRVNARRERGARRAM